MTKKALLTAIKNLLIAQTWTGGSNVVFGTGSVLITRGVDIADATKKQAVRTPFALIVPGAGVADPLWGEDPNLLVSQVVIRIGVLVPGDAVGENPLMGANRPDTTKSEGAGLYDVEQMLYTAVGKLNAQEGIILQFKNTGDSGATLIDDKNYLAYEDHLYEMIATEV